MIANLRVPWPDISFRWSVENFWIVVTMIRAPLAIASLTCYDVPSIFLTTPAVCSNCETVF